MIDLGCVSESEVVLTFVRAEIEAPRYRNWYLNALRDIQGSHTKLIDDADLSNDSDNAARAYLLGAVRGYRRNAMLFKGFPDKVSWRRCEVEVTELGEFLYANFATLLELSGASRRVSEGAKKALIVPQTFSAACQDMVSGISPIIRRIEVGHQFEDCIAVRDGRFNTVVLVDGHTRATAYVAAQKPKRTRVLVGTSAVMHEWWLI